MRSHQLNLNPEKVSSLQKQRNTSTITPVINEAVNLMRSISNKRAEKDEYSLFGEQVAMKLRKLVSPYARFSAQNVINNALFDAEMGKFDNNAPCMNHFQASASPLGFAPPTPNVGYRFMHSPGNYSTYTSSPSPSVRTLESTSTDNEEDIDKLLCDL